MIEYNTYLFDVDGTLIDTAELIYQCFKYTCKEIADIDVNRDLVMKHIGLPFKEQLITYIGELNDEQVEAIFLIHMRYQSTQYKKYLRPFEDIRKLLEELKNRKKKIGIVTSRKKETLIPYLKETGLDGFYEVIISPEDTRLHKPHPDPIIKALSILKSNPDESIYIGDSIFDIESGDRANCDTAFVSWSNIDVVNCHIPPTYLLESPLDLIQ